jgi:ribosomal protein L7Ae-like RNA K-turn-binding protein
MAKVVLSHAVTLGLDSQRHNLKAGENEVSAAIEKPVKKTANSEKE